MSEAWIPWRQVGSGGLTQNSLEAVGQSRSQPGSWTVGGGGMGLVGGAPTLQAAVHGAAAAAAAAAQQQQVRLMMSSYQGSDSSSCTQSSFPHWHLRTRTTCSTLPCSIPVDSLLSNVILDASSSRMALCLYASHEC